MHTNDHNSKIKINKNNKLSLSFLRLYKSFKKVSFKKVTGKVYRTLNYPFLIFEGQRCGADFFWTGTVKKIFKLILHSKSSWLQEFESTVAG